VKELIHADTNSVECLLRLNTLLIHGQDVSTMKRDYYLLIICHLQFLKPPSHIMSSLFWKTKNVNEVFKYPNTSLLEIFCVLLISHIRNDDDSIFEDKSGLISIIESEDVKGRNALDDSMYKLVISNGRGAPKPLLATLSIDQNELIAAGINSWKLK
jgi:hypothetical protein